jgi:[acyl-carrier-protein] S-malonyltransferase
VADKKVLYVFPGQGSQYRGMGSDLVAEFQIAKDIYARASAVVG